MDRFCKHGELIVDGQTHGCCLECDLEDPAFAEDFFKYMRECDEEERQVQTYEENYDTK